jgi:hypothetical protein
MQVECFMIFLRSPYIRLMTYSPKIDLHGLRDLRVSL